MNREKHKQSASKPKQDQSTATNITITVRKEHRVTIADGESGCHFRLCSNAHQSMSGLYYILRKVLPNIELIYKAKPPYMMLQHHHDRYERDKDDDS